MGINLPRSIGIGHRMLKAGTLVAAMLLFNASLYGQNVTVSGTVTDKGTPLPGVSIVVKGTSIGTATDAEGKYALQVNSPSATLIFSFIGYKTKEVDLNNQTTVDIALEEDATALNEVVVTALGIQRDVKALGFAVQKVEGAVITKAREPNIINSLTGRVAGLQIQNQTDFFQNPIIKLRGSNALIVIDGVPSVDADIWKINADDIESFSVLKGATASALYGSIGSGGAIMITTKRGNGQTKVEVNSSTMFQPSFIRIPDVQQTYGNGNNGQYAYTDGSGGGLEGGGWIWGPKLDQRDPSTPSGFFETTQYDSPIDPVTGDRIPTPFVSRGKNNVKNFFRTGIISTNNVSVSGGTATTNYRISVSNTYQKGIVPNTDLNNTSFAVSGGFAISSKLKADASLTYNRQYTDNFPEIGYGPENYLYNLVLWIGPDIDIQNLKGGWIKGQEGVQQLNYNKSWYNNPYFQAQELKRGYYKDNVFGQFKLDYNILPGFDLTMRTGMNVYGLNRTYKEPKSYVRYDNVSNGNFYLTNESSLNLNTDVIARYSKKISNNFSLDASAGGANRWRELRSNTANTDGLVIPEYFSLRNSANPVKADNELQQERVTSAYGTLDLEFMRGIFLGVTARNDWVSTLPLNNNSFFYPSASLSGVISDFLDLSAAKVSFLKVRASWARVGIGKITTFSDTYPYQHIAGFTPGTSWNNHPSLSWPGVDLSKPVQPATANTTEVGIDVRFLEGRLGLDVAAFTIDENTNVITRPVSITSLYSSRLLNQGAFQKRGLEVTVTAAPVKTDHFTWNVTANWSTIHRYLKSEYSGGSLFIKEGTRMDQIYGFSYLHTPGGKLVLGSNGFPLDDPYQRKLGNYDPDYIFGVQNTLTYNNFSMSFSFDGRVGGKMYSTTNQKMWWGGTHPGTVNQYRDDANAGKATYIADGVVVVEGGVTYDENGKITEDTRVYAPNTTPVNYISWNINTSNAYLNHYYNQTFVKLREVTFTYNFPKEMLSKTFIQKASFSLVGRNLLLFTKMPNVDPDPGSDNLQTPSTRNMGFNFNFTF